eukprot:5382023-Prymnesium_polylepis.1
MPSVDFCHLSIAALASLSSFWDLRSIVVSFADWDNSGTGGRVSLLSPIPSCTRMSMAFDVALPWAVDPPAGAPRSTASAGVL